MKKRDRETLRGELKRAFKDAGARQVRVVTTGCMDLCPKDGVAIATAAGLATQPPRLWVLDEHAPAQAACELLAGPDALA